METPIRDSDRDEKSPIYYLSKASTVTVTRRLDGPTVRREDHRPGRWTQELRRDVVMQGSLESL